MTIRKFPLLLLLLCLLVGAASVQAGIPECGGLRIEAEAHCEVKLSCEASCSAKLYRKKCATQLYNRCHEECETPPSVVCTGDCGSLCASQCARGVDVVCQHNCFPECVETCGMTCASDVEPERCQESCRATCDGECTVQCSELPPTTTCVEHCEECCVGSCRAIAGMGCQVTCQQEEFEVCESGVDVECKAGCDGGGSLFCDGQFVAGPTEIAGCVQGLTAVGIAALNGDLYLDADVGAELAGSASTVRDGAEEVERGTRDTAEKAKESSKEALALDSGGCGVEPGSARGSRGGFRWWVALLGVTLLARRRR